MLTANELERYARHIVLREVGGPGQAALKEASVLVIGAGGLGAPVLMYLAAAGVGTLGAVDDDVVSLSNLQRQIIHTTPDIGRRKVDSAAQQIHALNPHVHFEAHAVRLNAKNAMSLIGGYDLVLDGSDNFETRYLVSDACFLAGKPLITAALGQFDGSLTTIRAHEHGADGEFNPTYRCLFPEPPPPGTVPACAEAGVMGALAGMLGSMMALEAIREIVGFGESLVGRLVMVDARAMRFETLRYARDPANPAQRRYACHHRFERIRGTRDHRFERARGVAFTVSRCPCAPSASPDSARRPRRPEETPWRAPPDAHRRQFDIERAERLGEPVAAARADQRHDVVALRRDPGDRDLRRRCAEFVGDCAQRFHQRQVGVEIAALEARAHRRENPCAAERSFDQCPLIRPRDSTP